MSGRAIILLAGELPAWPEELKIESDDLVICADGGFDHALRLGLTPHLLLGDMDSIDPGHLSLARERGIEIVTYPVEKDMTDSDLALATAHGRGCGEVILLGAFGGQRLDHSIANLFLLARWHERGLKVILFDQRSSAQVISDEDLSISGAPGDYVSLIPLSPTVTGVTTSGLRYPLHAATLELGSTLGVSNELTHTDATVSCRTGLLLVIVNHKSETF